VKDAIYIFEENVIDYVHNDLLWLLRYIAKQLKTRRMQRLRKGSNWHCRGISSLLS